MKTARGCWVFLLLAAAGSLSATLAGDWPQVRGPRQDGTSDETGLRTAWPEKGPPLLWEKEVGQGYSAPVVTGDRLILFHRVGDTEVVVCLGAKDGKGLWKFAYPSTYEDDFNKGNGPRSTPVIAGGRVYTLGAEGELYCLELATGKEVWHRSLGKDFQVPRSFFGVGTSPVHEGKLLLVNVGAKKAGIVAFHDDTGKTAWTATDDGASYATPVVATLGGARTAVFFTRQGVVLLDPRDGEVRYQKRWRSRMEASVNAASPLVVGDLVFFSACYDTGALLLRVRKDRVEEVWNGEDSLSNHYNTSLCYQGHLYGIDGRQESGARLRCVELKTGKVRWTQEGFGCASMILSEGRLIALTERGDLVLVEATPAAYREKARAAVLGALPCRAEIALAHGLLYGRDQRKLACWDLRR
jgi:outer membrane protein assembly factor BamB